MRQDFPARLVPVLTAAADNCLTRANWEEVGIMHACYYLDALLTKPGAAILQTCKNLKNFSGWQKTIILNASLLTFNQKGNSTIRSPYDGNLINLNEETLFSLINNLQPEMILLPYALSKRLPFLIKSKIVVSAPENEAPYEEDFFGYYLTSNKNESFADYLLRVKHCTGKPLYAIGEFTIAQALLLQEKGIGWIETNQAVDDALKGNIYTNNGIFCLLDNQMASWQEIIDKDCSCPTCIQKFTRAYLHHLLLQTPLLCQRFLIQHNVHYYQSKLQASIKEQEIV